MKCSTKGLLVLAATALLPVVANAASSAPAMCAKPDKVLFSCPLAGSKKTVSLCAAGDVADGNGHFYYAYGADPTKPELTYPEPGARGEFTRTFLHYAGNTGGFAYAFTRDGFKYVVYSVSGSHGMEHQGLVVLRDGEAKPIKNSTCQAGRVTESEDRGVVDVTFKWPEDPAIDQANLPLPDR